MANKKTIKSVVLSLVPSDCSPEDCFLPRHCAPIARLDGNETCGCVPLHDVLMNLKCIIFGNKCVFRGLYSVVYINQASSAVSMTANIEKTKLNYRLTFV